MKKILLYAGMFLGSFAVINTGMYFFLSATQPKTVVAAADEHSGEPVAVAKDAHSDVKHEEAALTAAIHEEEHAEIADERVASESQLTDKASTAVVHDAPQEESRSKRETSKDVEQRPLKKEAAHATADKGQAANTNNEDIPADEIAEAIDAAEQYVPPAPAQTPQQTPDTSSAPIAKLAKLLESMKPADAASIAAELDSDIIVKIVLRMKDRNAAKLMAALPVEIAQDVAQQMTLMSSR